MISQTADIQRIRSLRRDLLLSRIKRTNNRVAEVESKLCTSNAEMVQIECYRRDHLQTLRKPTQSELKQMSEFKQFEVAGLFVQLQFNKEVLARERTTLREIEVKLEALQQFINEAQDSVDDHNVY